MTIPDIAIPAHDLIPHRPPIVFIDRVTGTADSCVTSSFTVPGDSPYLDNVGRLMPEALLEVMAQCFAAGAGLQAASAGQEISWGYLAAVRDMWVYATVFSGDTLHAEAKHRMSVGPLHIVDCRVLRDGIAIASAQLKIFIPEDREP